MKIKDLKERLLNEHGKIADENIAYLHLNDELAATPGMILESHPHNAHGTQARVTSIHLQESHNTIMINMDNGEHITNIKLFKLIEAGLITITEPSQTRRHRP